MQETIAPMHDCRPVVISISVSKSMTEFVTPVNAQPITTHETHNPNILLRGSTFLSLRLKDAYAPAQQERKMATLAGVMNCAITAPHSAATLSPFMQVFPLLAC